MTAADPWVDLTPGDLGRLATTAEPREVARDLSAWVTSADQALVIARWLDKTAAALAELATSEIEDR